VPPVAEGRDTGEFPTPPHRALRQGVEEQPAQIAAQNLGAPVLSVVGEVEEHGAGAVQHARRLGTLVNDRPERLGEAGGCECALAVVVVDVELAALGPAFRPGLRLVDDRGDAMDMEDTGQHQSTQSRTDDDDGLLHCALSLLWNGVP